MTARGEEFRDDFRKALPKEPVQRLSRISPWRSARSVPQYNLPELHRELADRGLLAGAEVLGFGAAPGKIFNDRLRSAA